MLSALISYIAQLRRHSRTAKLTREQLESRRLADFRKLVRHACRNSVYYREIVKERGIDPEKCVPTDFPVLTKRLLSDRFDDIVTDKRVTRAGLIEFLHRSRDPRELYLNKFVTLHTSGSSGEVGYFVYSLDDWNRGLAGASRALPVGSGRIAFYGATGGHFGGVSLAVSAERGLGRLLFNLAMYEINAPLAETIAGLNAFRPDVLTGYPSGNKILAEAQLAGKLNIRPKIVECSGEPLSHGDQLWLEQVFGCPCVNIYATTEHFMMGVARTHDRGMTLFDDDLIFEMADDHVLVTNLLNSTLPLIRYRMSDGLRPMDIASPYGPFSVIEPVLGRNEWIPQFRNRRGEVDFISPHIINEIFIPDVWRFQMRWRNETAFHFAICVIQGLDESQRAAALAATKKRLHEILAQKGLDNVAFTVAIVDDIPPDPKNGKFRLITQS